MWLTLELMLGPGDALQLHKLTQLSRLSGVPLAAAGQVHMHVRSRKPLQDVTTAVRLGQPVAESGFALQANAEAHPLSLLRSQLSKMQLLTAEQMHNYPNGRLVRPLTTHRREFH